jgi:HlyD family secretion protein
MAFSGQGQSSFEISRALDALKSPDGKKLRWFIAGGAVLLTLGGLYFAFGRSSDAVTYKTAAVSRQNLVIVVTATGTLEPVKEVQIGTEISGTVQEVLVEENDRVRKGQALARLNTEKLEAEHSQTASAVASAEASLVEASATVTEAGENLARLEELFRLSKGMTPSRQDLETARATVNRALAKENSARAAIKESRARLSVAEINLRKAVVRSPIDGIVLLREIEPGQTVAASLSTPKLFVIAENLTQLYLKVAVDEADIGRVRPGQEATFTVDAFAGKSFPARITHVRYSPDAAESTSNKVAVVTYQTTLRVNNTDLLLRPGMTATAEVIVEKIENALVVPNAALRFEPEAEKPKQGFLASLIPMRPRRPPPQKKSGERRVWILKDGVPQAVSITAGSTDGTHTVIAAAELKEGSEVIVDTVGGSN